MRYRTKGILTWIMHLFTWPFGLVSVISYRLRGSEYPFVFSAKILSLVPGRIGQYLRSSFYGQTLVESTYDLAVGFCSYFAHPTASVARKVSIGSFSIIGMARIEENVLIGSRVSILSGKYQHGGGPGSDSVDSNMEPHFEEVRIGRDSWLGEGCIVMADIGERCVVSAGSVVTKAMPPEHTAIGNPARFIKWKKESE